MLEDFSAMVSRTVLKLPELRKMPFQNDAEQIVRLTE